MCHNERLKTGGLALDGADVTQVKANAALWEKVVRKVRSGAMPPLGQDRPDQTAVSKFLSALEDALDRAAAASPNPGKPAAHRLNRVEYVNAIHDLLALTIDGAALLPADDSSYGFDNNSDMLSVTPAVLERYMSAATKISRLAVGDPSARPVIQRYTVSPFLRQTGRMSEALPFGSRGGSAIQHIFPLNGEYELKVRLQRGAVNSITGFISGLEQRQELEARIDGALVQRWSVGGEIPPGAYDAGISIDPTDTVAVNRRIYMQTADQHLRVRFAVRAGTRVVGVAFLATAPGIIEGSGGAGGGAKVDTIEVSGPYNPAGASDTPSRRRIFLCQPASPAEEAPCARRILRTLARRAFRRPVSDADIHPLLEFFEKDRSAGFDAGIQAALERLLISPEFLFRVERGPVGAAPGTAFRLSDVELASRIAFFLWSSIPDDELLMLAERGRLKDPSVLTAQVRRMLADRRANALVTNFAGQWLLVRNTRLLVPDAQLFPSFDDSLKEAFAREIELFFDSQLREDRSALDLLRADYTYINDRLAEHYGIPNIYGSHFRRVTLSDPARFGLLGKGSVLLVTSYPHRTSPVLRGKWVLESLLGAPPPPPPPNVPSLRENDPESKSSTVRERLEQHRQNALCASCHALMDPLGFALENFDGIGRWRTADGGSRIDASSVLLDGTKVEGPVAFRQALLAHHREDYVTTLVEKLLTYALGRGVEFYDMPAVRRIVREAARTEYRWSDLVLGVVRSTAFQMNRTPVPENSTAARAH
jgi:hypothetical protein